jgi:ABC-type multidrug transport system ATPase subunit
MLDDVFSGLDAISEDRIFSRLLGKNGLLRELGTTVILVTHAAHRLNYADHIISLSTLGTVSEQGKFGDLVSANGYIAGLETRRLEEAEDTSKGGCIPVKAKVADDTARQNAAADIHRPIGDWAIYEYYFASAGWQNVGVWMGLMLCYSLLLRFPGETFPIVGGNLLMA